MKMGGACSTYGGGVHRDFGGETWDRERDHLEDLGVDGRIILEWIFSRHLHGGMNKIHLAQDMDRWRALVYTVMNLRVL
jgi:hypothetical protein